jgi:hypothetical protein
MNNLKHLAYQINSTGVNLTATSARRIYTAKVNNTHVYIRLNDFPDEPMYTIISEGDALDLETLSFSKNLDTAPPKGATTQSSKLLALTTQPIHWEATSSPDIGRTKTGEEDVYFRINEWPEPECTIIAYGEALDLNEIPSLWTAKRE